MVVKSNPARTRAKYQPAVGLPSRWGKSGATSESLTGGAHGPTATKDHPFGLLPIMRTKEERLQRLVSAGLLPAKALKSKESRSSSAKKAASHNKAK